MEGVEEPEEPVSLQVPVETELHTPLPALMSFTEEVVGDIHQPVPQEVQEAVEMAEMVLYQVEEVALLVLMSWVEVEEVVIIIQLLLVEEETVLLLLHQSSYKM